MKVIIYIAGSFAGALLTWLFIYANTGHRHRKRRGFTDRLYIYNMYFVMVTVIASFVAMFFSGRLGITDLSPIGAIVPAAFGELAIHTGFVVWKAKVENCRKHKDVNAAEQLEEVDTWQE